MTFVAFTNNIMIKVGLTRLTTETPSLEGKSAKGDVVVVGVSLYLEEIIAGHCEWSHNWYFYIEIRTN